MFRNNGEEKAFRFLEAKGHRLLSSNYLTPDRRTEIDLITVLGTTVHFIEVKDWRSGDPRTTQNRKRQAMVRRAASIFMSSDTFLFHPGLSEGKMPVDGENHLCIDEMPDQIVSRKTVTSTGDVSEDLCPSYSGERDIFEEYSVSFDLVWIQGETIQHLERIF